MNKINKETLDIKAEHIEKLKELFPSIVTDGKIDFDQLKTILGQDIDESNERYQFTWNGKRDVIKLAQTASTGTLRPSKEDSVDWNMTENLYIEGDNLEVLKQLQKTYFGKIKMIYIDPPYNTGGDFVYKDNFRDSIKNYKEVTNQQLKSNPETSGRYHTDWLNMMYPRLMLARNLLTDDGVIFVSIDDNEVENLKKIMSEIFGESNYIGFFCVENNPKGRKNSKFISVTNEFCIVFAKDKNSSYFLESIPKKSSDMNLDEDGKYVHNSGKRVLVGENKFNNFIKSFNSDKHYTVYYNPLSNETILKKEELLKQTDKELSGRGFKRYISYIGEYFVENTYTSEKFMELVKLEKIDFKEDKIYEKNLSSLIRIKSILNNKAYKAIKNNLEIEYTLDFKTTSAGTKIKKLFNSENIYFDSPKNESFIKLLIELLDGLNFYVLDFFSGSATTAHAVMKLNAEDGGNRKFIMVQLPEKTDESSEAYKAGYENICEIGKERIRRAGKQIKEELEKEGKDTSSLDIGFKVFKLDETNIKAWDAYEDVSNETLFSQEDILKDGRNKDDLLYEILLKYGVFDKKVTIITVNQKMMYRVGENSVIIDLSDAITLDDVKAIALLKPMTVIFYEDGFEDDNVKINAEVILKDHSVEDVRSI